MFGGIFGNRRGELYVECRRCGHVLSGGEPDDGERCPACGSTEIASYRIR